MKNLLLILILMISLSGCATGEKMSWIEPGMSKKDVSEIMGNPDGYEESNGYEIYSYKHRLKSGWAWHRADYAFIFENDKLIKYGTGNIREHYTNTQSIFLFNN